MMLEWDLLATPFYIIKRLQREFICQYGAKLTGKVLDVGCGKSPYRRYLGASEYIGLDDNPGVGPDVIGNISAIPFEEDTFDGVLCTEVLEHIPDPRQGIAEVSRVLKPGGTLYITVPMSWCLHYEPYDYFRFTKYGLQYLLEEAGFGVLETARVGGVASLCAQRKLDFLYFLLLRAKLPAKVALSLLAPFSLVGFYVSRIFDRIDERDALGWAILAQKPIS